MNFFYKCIIKIANLIYPFKVIGKENLPQGKAVLVCNHFSFIDPVYLVSIQKKGLKILAKKELFKKRFISGILKSCGGIPVDRDNPEISTLISSMKVLKEGNKLAIFPEGTRNKTNTINLQPIKSGSALFAVKSKSPIVPIMILRKARLFRKNYLIIGKPFEFNEYYEKKLSQDDYNKLDKIIVSKMKEEQKLLIDELFYKKIRTKTK